MILEPLRLFFPRRPSPYQVYEPCAIIECHLEVAVRPIFVSKVPRPAISEHEREPLPLLRQNRLYRSRPLLDPPLPTTLFRILIELYVAEL
jgi:hypothetical protein